MKNKYLVREHLRKRVLVFDQLLEVVTNLNFALPDLALKKLLLQCLHRPGKKPNTF